MKLKHINIFRLTLILILIGFSFAFNQIHAQIQNADFEYWNSNGPVGWIVDNNSDGSIQPITQTTNSYTGSYAVRGEVLTKEIQGQKFLFPPSLNGVFPYTNRPGQITMYVMFKPVGGDELDVVVELSKDGKGVGYSLLAHTGIDSGYTRFVVPITYADSILAPDSLGISFTVGGPNGSLPHAGSVFYVDDISTISLTRPQADSLIVSGEKYTIKWKAENAKNIDLSYSLDKGAHYNSIVTNYPSDSNHYVWKVPLSLISRKSKVRIENSDDKNNYDEVPCRIKPWELTRLDANGNYVPFRPDKDGWYFPNWGSYPWPKARWKNINYQGYDKIGRRKYPNDYPFAKAQASRYPTWNDWVNTFGKKDCYMPPSYGRYKNKSTRLWYHLSDSVFDGACFGFAVTSLLYFYHRDEFLKLFPKIGKWPRLIDAPDSEASQKAIERYFTYQFGKHFYKEKKSKQKNVSAINLLAQLKTMFERDNGDAAPLIYTKEIENRNTSDGAHAVVPYKLERIGESHSFHLKIYDNNYPRKLDRTITIDSAHNEWTDEEGWAGTHTKGCYLMDNSAYFLKPVALFKRSNRVLSDSPLSLAQNIPLWLLCTSNAHITISSDSGKTINYRDSLIYNNIDSAYPIIPIVNKYHPPYGYSLPESRYSIKINKFTAPSPYILFVTDTIMYTYRRDDANFNQSDNLYYNNGVRVSNPNTSSKKIDLETIIDMGNVEKVFEVNNLQFNGGDSLHIKQVNFNSLILQNFGKSGLYELRVKYASPNGGIDFVHNAINLSSNSSQLIKPSWGNLDSNKVKILIDNGNNGTYDDSIVVSNQVTQVKGMFSSKVPSHFKLFQNYPNPFNPTTTIKYQIPKSEFVMLKVYNILGQSVKTLVNSNKAAGSYSIQFNGNNLSSGVYFYVLKAGSFTSIKKLVLMK